MVIIDLILILFLTTALWLDFKDGIIPNELIYIGMSGCLLTIVRQGRFELFIAFGKQMVLVFILLYPLFKIGALGAGDIKLFMMCAGFHPYQNIVKCLICSFAIGAVLGIIKLWRENIWRQRIAYFLDYAKEIAVQRRFSLYGEEWQPATSYVSRAVQISGNQIHFSLPIFVSVLLQMGGFY